MAAPIKWTKDLEESVLLLFANGHSPLAISQKFNWGRNTALNFLKRYGVYSRKSYCTQRKYSLNECFWQTIDSEEKAYWAGFMAADGCIESHRVISVELMTKDRDHLQKLLCSLGSDRRIYDCRKKKKSSKIVINSTQIVNDLLKIGITKRKSLTLDWPKSFPKNLIRHFIRGYFDGDGMWSYSKTQMTFGFIGSASFIASLKDILKEKCLLSDVKTIKGKKVDVIRWNGNKQSKRFYQYIYGKSNIFLDRKKIFADSKFNITL